MTRQSGMNQPSTRAPRTVDRRRFVGASAVLGASLASLGRMRRPSGLAFAQSDVPGTPTPPCFGGCDWDGQKITIQVVDSASSMLVTEAKAEFEAATGASLEIVIDPIDRALLRLHADAGREKPIYDGSLIALDWLPGLVEADLLLPIDDDLADRSGQFFDISATIAADPASLQRLRAYAGSTYAVPNDCDCHLLYFRRDLVSDPVHAAEFEAAKGYPLPVSLSSWQALVDIADYFSGKPNGIDGEPLIGMAIQARPEGQGAEVYASISASFVIGPDNAHHYWFDPEDMTPLVASPGHQHALETYVSLAGLGPAGMGEWSLGEAWNVFLAGGAVFTIGWGDVIPVGIDIGAPALGRIGTALLPGAPRYTHPLTGVESAAERVNQVGNTTGSSWSGVVMRSTPAPELVYQLWSMLALPQKQAYYAARGRDGIDPGRQYQYAAPVGSAPVESFTSQGWNADDAVGFCRASRETFEHPLQLPYLRVLESHRYWRALNVRISDAVTGIASVPEILNNLVDDFEMITNEVGRDRQRAVYRTSLGL